ncbi:bifunctional hydroxymethylpyrimidine kinase/phosphomethylpyrimidine kinase [Pontivivens insulae]|uniref:hydroxymethylpyrimidine kinase n=1 Tax=Pontivivens insulae TaxID=1639689 RepID=A0A2R8A6X9_9RHOB|nr:bifunctional hydroxymethylpyrimidine kinase/phosphomethylpyrimidine kinase [Pontivivens insulae]RED18106.1 hydroxymethylpyrimidine kinase /phosphomethylpyrimidine kinase [Pontivivens insulae]SPF28003.1 Hydroxymethylpyrimidine/phosphomethylpyrimidine kinase [Pontivivens insulae]
MVARALTIAGSDSGGGAGIQADLKAFSAMGVYGASAVTAVTAQNTRSVTAIHPIPDDVVAAQIEAVLDDIQIDAIKIGMLGTPSLIKTVAHALKDYTGPIILDPVMVAKSGAVLLADEAVDALKAELVGRATLLTPNLPEAAALVGAGEVGVQADALLKLGARAVLMKGGHADGAMCEDLFVSANSTRTFTAVRINTANTHGTGCSLSSAIAAGLAQSEQLETAVEKAHGWLHQAIRAADELGVGRGHGPVHHFHALWS